LVCACHDLSEGGLGVAAAEMTFGASLGLDLDLQRVPAEGDIDMAALLWSESPSRFLVEVAPEHSAAFEQCFADLPAARVGVVSEGGELRIRGLAGEIVLAEPVAALKAAWRRTPFNLEEGT
jgi:phosphoribosylformylglycinamidine synthase